MSSISVKFADTLRGLGVKARAILYEGKTHTDVFLQVNASIDHDSRHSILLPVSSWSFVSHTQERDQKVKVNL